MKKLLFVLPSFTIGGTTVSTKNLISLLDSEKYDISVLAMSNTGELKDLYLSCKQLKSNIFLSSLSLNSWKLEPNVFKRYVGAILRKIVWHSPLCRSFCLKVGLSLVEGLRSFDVILACEEGITTQCVSLSRVRNKIAWVRCDYQKYIERNNGLDEKNIYLQFNNIICVSDFTSQNFKRILPQLTDRVYAINNPQNSQIILAQAELCPTDNVQLPDTDHFTILSVGRFDPVKRFSQIPHIAKQLKQRGVDFKWYILGPNDNDEGEATRQAIIENAVDDEVILLGASSNPHYYIKQSDLLVCLSKSEACPRVINEAKILSTPTICTDFSTSYEFIENGVTGIIAPIDRISDSISAIYNDRDKYNDLKMNILKFNFDNSLLIRNIDELLNV